MSGLERLSCLLAAVCHDVDHPGLNQMFLVVTENPLAFLYEVIIYEYLLSILMVLTIYVLIIKLHLRLLSACDRCLNSVVFGRYCNIISTTFHHLKVIILNINQGKARVCYIVVGGRKYLQLYN